MNNGNLTTILQEYKNRPVVIRLQVTNGGDVFVGFCAGFILREDAIIFPCRPFTNTRASGQPATEFQLSIQLNDLQNVIEEIRDQRIMIVTYTESITVETLSELQCEVVEILRNSTQT